MEYPWLKTPLFRVFLPFLAGILIAITLFKGQSLPNSIFSYILMILAIIASLPLARKKIQLYWLNPFLIVLLFFSIGWERVNQTYSFDDAKHFSKYAVKNSYLLLQIKEPPVIKEETVQVKGVVKGVKQDDQIFPTSGKVVAYLEKDSLSNILQYGDILLTANEFDTLEPPPNPKQFNLKSFLANKQIYHQAFLDSKDWEYTGINKGGDFFYSIYQVRKKLLNWLRSTLTREDEKAVAFALLAGYKEAIDPELRQSYSSTGAMHVLAVSGLHVGIIYLMLNMALSFLNPLPYGNYIKMALIIGILWLYACLTGLPPSVIRASTMFTFVAIGNNLQRITNIYGSILASLFFLLFINPFLITQVGFQLSYAAVTGIVFLQPKIYNLLPQSRYWLIDQIWAITAVSIAAQLSTFPLTLFYFNQFPTYFMVSNLVVIPAAFLIVPTGFVFFIIKGLGWQVIAPLGELLGNVLDYLLYSLNFLIKSVQNFPYSLIDEIFITSPEFWLIYAVLVGFIFGFVFRNKGWFFTGMIAATVFMSIQNYQLWKYQNLNKWAVLAVDKSTVVAHLKPGQAIMKGPEKTLSNEEQLKFNTYRFLWSQGLSKHDIIKQPLKKDTADNIRDKNFIQKRTAKLSNKRIFIADKHVTFPDSTQNQLPTDQLILANEPETSPEAFLENLSLDKLILGPEVPPWELSNWKKTARQNNVNIYSITTRGALVENL